MPADFDVMCVALDYGAEAERGRWLAALRKAFRRPGSELTRAEAQALLTIGDATSVAGARARDLRDTIEDILGVDLARQLIASVNRPEPVLSAVVDDREIRLGSTSAGSAKRGG